MTSNIESKRVLDLADSHTKAKLKESVEVVDIKTDKTSEDRPSYAKLVGVVKSELESTMKPEFLNRIDDIVVFQPLTQKELSLIAAMMVVEIRVRAKYERNVSIAVSDALLQKMVEEGSKSSSKFGARPMRRAVQRIFEDAISDAVVQGFLGDGDVATFDLQQDMPGSDVPYQVTVIREVLNIEVDVFSRDS